MTKQFIAWARVSSARQKEEGWSLEHQEERLRDYAARCGGNIVKLYVVAETASKHHERQTFQEMLQFARHNSKRIDGLLVMKIDRAARNMRDFVALEQLEEDHGVKLISITQPTENTPSGKMMRRTFATFATFFTEQLSVDVKAAMKRRAEAGLFVTLAPYGYRNVRGTDNRRVVEVDASEAAKVRRLFQLYAYENHTLDSLKRALVIEGISYKPERPAWTRSKLYELLTDRSYIGDVDHLGTWYPGSHDPIVDRSTFERVQSLLGRHSYKAHQMLFAGGLIKCGHCDHPITGELKTKKTATGERRYTYYRCSTYNAAGHPRIRVPESRLDASLLSIFDRLRIRDDDERDLYIDIFRAKTRGTQYIAAEQRQRVAAELKRVRNQKDVLLNLRLNGQIEDATYSAKHLELRDREAGLQIELDRGGVAPSDGFALKAFELSQNLATKWVRANSDQKRRIIEIVTLNLRLVGASLDAQIRSPFDMLAEGAESKISAQDRTPIGLSQRFIAAAMGLPAHIQSLIRDYASIDAASA
jgi:site-specific DNA recombinase